MELLDFEAVGWRHANEILWLSTPSSLLISTQVANCEF